MSNLPRKTYDPYDKKIHVPARIRRSQVDWLQTMADLNGISVSAMLDRVLHWAMVQYLAEKPSSSMMAKLPTTSSTPSSSGTSP
jgi:hypothetical protein